MAAQPDPRLTRFREELLPIIMRVFAPDRVIAFGSRTRGEALRSSDLDLIVVARSFANVPWVDRQARVQEAIGAPFAMDFLCYTPEEFARKVEEFGVVQTAARTGIVLHPAAA
ncbi:MAG: nucleotidyltransferase [Gemmatimonas sp.]|nr:nucleotidyltransferase [Gemmatimonas sp.]